MFKKPDFVCDLKKISTGNKTSMINFKFCKNCQTEIKILRRETYIKISADVGHIVET